MTNVMVKTCLNQKIIKKSNLIQAMKNNVCPKATVTIRRPNFLENWICPKIHRMFRSVDWTHDMIVVKWREGTVIQYFRKPNLSEYLPNVPECSGVRIEHTTRWWWSDTYSFDTSAHLALWQMRHRFNPRKRVNDYQLYSMIGAHVYVLYHRQLIFALSCRRRSFSQVLQFIRRIFWEIFCVSDDDKCYVDNMS